MFILLSLAIVLILFFIVLWIDKNWKNQFLILIGLIFGFVEYVRYFNIFYGSYSAEGTATLIAYAILEVFMLMFVVLLLDKIYHWIKFKIEINKKIIGLILWGIVLSLGLYLVIWRITTMTCDTCVDVEQIIIN